MVFFIISNIIITVLYSWPWIECIVGYVPVGYFIYPYSILVLISFLRTSHWYPLGRNPDREYTKTRIELLKVNKITYIEVITLSWKLYDKNCHLYKFKSTSINFETIYKLPFKIQFWTNTFRVFTWNSQNNY